MYLNHRVSHLRFYRFYTIKLFLRALFEVINRKSKQNSSWNNKWRKSQLTCWLNRSWASWWWQTSHSVAADLKKKEIEQDMKGFTGKTGTFFRYLIRDWTKVSLLFFADMLFFIFCHTNSVSKWLLWARSPVLRLLLVLGF